MKHNNLHYNDYLQLQVILNAQSSESGKAGKEAHDERLFIIIHQTYELWFGQLLYELESVNFIMQKPELNDNSPELQTVVHRLSRMVTILNVLVHQIDIMETMTPMDFLDFRDLLRPASGFQSWQFKILEARLGLAFQQRHGKEYYISQLRPQEVELIKDAESKPSLKDLLNSWLERMPFFDEPGNWIHYRSSTDAHTVSDTQEGHIFWLDYRNRYLQSLAPEEKLNEEYFNAVFFSDQAAATGSLSPKACRAALFIMLYRGYPILQLPFQLLNNLLEIDEQLSNWRYRHMNMVHRMIGTRIGTGGSSGRDYLRGAADRHYIFSDITRLTSFLIERQKLPPLSPEMELRLGFLHS